MSGKDKGKQGTVLRVLRSHNLVLVQGCNLAWIFLIFFWPCLFSVALRQVKKHLKATEQQKGGIFTKEAPVHYSNCLVLDPTDKWFCFRLLRLRAIGFWKDFDLFRMPTSIGFKFLPDGKKVQCFCSSPSNVNIPHQLSFTRLKVRVSKRTGTIIPKPDIAFERKYPRPETGCSENSHM